MKYEKYVQTLREMDRQFNEIKFEDTERQEREEASDSLKYSNEVYEQIKKQKD